LEFRSDCSNKYYYYQIYDMVSVSLTSLVSELVQKFDCMRKGKQFSSVLVSIFNPLATILGFIEKSVQIFYHEWIGIRTSRNNFDCFKQPGRENF